MSLIFQYDFDNLIDNKIEDLSDNQLDLSLNDSSYDGLVSITGYNSSKKSFELIPSKYLFNLLSNNKILRGNSFSLCFNIYFNTPSSYPQTVISSYNGSDSYNALNLRNEYGMKIELDNTNSLDCIIYGLGSNLIVTFGSIEIERWYNIGVTFDSDNQLVTTYLNAILMEEVSLPNAEYGGIYEIRIGQTYEDETDTANLEGIIDNLILYDYKLNSTEVDNYYKYNNKDYHLVDYLQEKLNSYLTNKKRWQCAMVCISKNKGF